MKIRIPNIHQSKDDDYEISKPHINLQYDDIIILRNTGDREIYEEELKESLRVMNIKNLIKFQKMETVVK